MTTRFSDNLVKWQQGEQLCSLPYRVIASIIVICLFSYTTLNGANCKSLHNLNSLFEGSYTELLIIEDDSGESIAIEVPDCFVNTEPLDSDDENDSENDFCSYCLVMSGGTGLTHSFPLFITPQLPSERDIFHLIEFTFNSTTVSTCSQRGPPVLSYCPHSFNPV